MGLSYIRDGRKESEMVVSHAALRKGGGKTTSRREVPEQRGSLTSGLLCNPHWEQTVGE